MVSKLTLRSVPPLGPVGFPGQGVRATRPSGREHAAGTNQEAENWDHSRSQIDNRVYARGYFTCRPSSSNCVVPSMGAFHATRSLVNCSIVGLSLVSCSEKSSTLPTRKMLIPGKAAPTRYISDPHVEQKKFVIVFSLPGSLTKTVRDWLYVFRISRPRKCFKCVS